MGKAPQVDGSEGRFLRGKAPMWKTLVAILTSPILGRAHGCACCGSRKHDAPQARCEQAKRTTKEPYPDFASVAENREGKNARDLAVSLWYGS